MRWGAASLILISLLVLIMGFSLEARADDCDRYISPGEAPPGDIVADCAGRTFVIPGAIAAILAAVLGGLRRANGNLP